MARGDRDLSSAGSAQLPLIDRRRRGPASRVVALNAVIVAGLAAFVWHQSARATNSVDADVATALYARPASNVRSLFAAITLGGKFPIVAALAIVVAAWMWLRVRDYVLAAFCPVAVGASALITAALKILVGRSRPDSALLLHESYRSFPSGHATAAAALATTVALLVVATRRSRRRMLVALLATYSVAVSASRLVLGAHFLTDVIAGTAVGVGATLAVALVISKSRQDDTPQAGERTASASSW